MSGIVLSASVRQNLLSLQSTADLLSTTQNRLATGKKVNTALDNPTNFFTAAVARQPRQRHQQPAGWHRQRRADPAGRQHRHHLAAEAGRYREVDRQPGAADLGRLFDQGNVDVTGTGAGVGTTTAADLNAGKLGGSVITFKTATGTLAVTIGSTFATGSGTATVKTLDQLNSVLASNGVAVSASISSTANTLTFTSTNDAASQTITTHGHRPDRRGR